MNKNALLTSMVILGSLLVIGCSARREDPAAHSARQLVRFVETGDTTLLRGVFADSLLKLMSIEEMVATREDIAGQFGDLQAIEGPVFPTDSTADLVLQYQDMRLLTSLEFNEAGAIRFLSIQPEPIASSGDTPGIGGDGSSVLTDLIDIRALAEVFDADSNYVRLVTLLSPT